MKIWTLVFRFENYSELKDWKKEKYHLALSLRLTGQTANWLSTRKDSVYKNYERLKVKLKERFGGGENKWLKETQLFERTQQSSDTADEFLDSLSVTCQQFKQESEILSIFVRGLRKYVQDFVVARQPNTLLEAQSFARLAETVGTLSHGQGR
jgi:hypothetical protein